MKASAQNELQSEVNELTITSSYIFFQNPYYAKKKNAQKDADSNVIELDIDSVSLRLQHLFSFDKNNVVSNSIMKNKIMISTI